MNKVQDGSVQAHRSLWRHGPYNSIQEGHCCKECFGPYVEREREQGNLIGLSERFRLTSQLVLQKVQDHVDGLPSDPCLEDEYVDKAIFHVTDGTDPDYLGTRELFILCADLPTEDCYCSSNVSNDTPPTEGWDHE